MKNIAEMLGIKTKAYQHWERNIYPAHECLVKLSRFYGVSIDALLTIDLSKKVSESSLVTKEQELYSKFIIQPENIKAAIRGLLQISV